MHHPRTGIVEIYEENKGAGELDIHLGTIFLIPRLFFPSLGLISITMAFLTSSPNQLFKKEGGERHVLVLIFILIALK